MGVKKSRSFFDKLWKGMTMKKRRSSKRSRKSKSTRRNKRGG
jgi:hypothetical protein